MRRLFSKLRLPGARYDASACFPLIEQDTPVSVRDTFFGIASSLDALLSYVSVADEPVALTSAIEWRRDRMFSFGLISLY